MECCTFLLLSTHAQIFEEKVANLSLAFKLMIDGVLLFQCSFFLSFLFITLRACIGFCREGGQCDPGL